MVAACRWLAVLILFPALIALNSPGLGGEDAPQASAKKADAKKKDDAVKPRVVVVRKVQAGAAAVQVARRGYYGNANVAVRETVDPRLSGELELIGAVSTVRNFQKEVLCFHRIGLGSQE